MISVYLNHGESEQYGLTLLDIGTCWPSSRIVQSRTISGGREVGRQQQWLSPYKLVGWNTKL